MKKLNKILAMFLAIVTLTCSIYITDVQAVPVTTKKTLKSGESANVDGIEISIVKDLRIPEIFINNTTDNVMGIKIKFYNYKNGKRQLITFKEYEDDTISKDSLYFRLKPHSKSTEEIFMRGAEADFEIINYSKDDGSKKSLDKQGKLDGVFYSAKLCNTKTDEFDFDYKVGTPITYLGMYLRNTNKFPVKVNGKVVYYGKSNKKLKTETFEDYLYANQRKIANVGETMLASTGVTKYKITYKATKVSLKTINKKLGEEQWGTCWVGSCAKYETSLYNVPLKDGHNDLGKKHYSDYEDKKQVYIKDFDYDKSTGTITFTAHYTKKITYKNRYNGWGTLYGNIGILVNYYDKDGYRVGYDYFSEHLGTATYMKGDTEKITCKIDVDDLHNLYMADPLEDIATIDFCFINDNYK